MTKREINVPILTRVEGEGALHIEMDGDTPSRVELSIYEPPRFFEGLLRGRDYLEASDVTARICGICPVAYQMSACHAMEDALGLDVSEEIRTLRRLLYCGEWIESHALHAFMLHAPDFLGLPDAIAMTEHHRDWVERGLFIKKTGNRLLEILGGRAIHPINVRVGGFYAAPSKRDLRGLLPDLMQARSDMADAVRWMSTFSFPELHRDYVYVALRHERDYPFCEGRLVSSAGLDIAIADYANHFEEVQVPHSTALHAQLRGQGPYLCGPLARMHLNFDRLGDGARALADEIGYAPPLRNPFRSLLARGIETVQALDEACHIIEEGYRPPSPSYVAAEVKAGVGHGCTEAPRGILYHRYRLEDDGAIAEATIIPPTSQNQPSIEDDVRSLATQLARLPHAEATHLAEHAVRNHDPCISCATHFLTLTIDR